MHRGPYVNRHTLNNDRKFLTNITHTLNDIIIDLVEVCVFKSELLRSAGHTGSPMPNLHNNPVFVPFIAPYLGVALPRDARSLAPIRSV